MTDVLEVEELPNDALKSPGCGSFRSTWGQLGLLEGHLGITWGVSCGRLGVTWGVTWGHLGSVEGHLGSVGGPKAPRASPLAFGGDSTAGGGGRERARWR